MLKVKNNCLKEINYEIKDEAKLSSLFGIGNGYYGIRGSLEEFGDVFIQGTYIRGIFDKIIEIPQTFSDNEYMKKYYFDGQKLKEFEYEDSCINICDFTTIRIFVNNKMFLPWEGKIIKWERYIDFKDGSLVRNVTWDDGENHLSEFHFRRTCSFDNPHLFFQEVKIKKINHNEEIYIESGIDTLVKTNGQHKSKIEKLTANNDGIDVLFSMGDFYHMEVGVSSLNLPYNLTLLGNDEKDEFYFAKYLMANKEATIRKIVCAYTSRDHDKGEDLISSSRQSLNKIGSYDDIARNHLIRYQKDFKQIDIKTAPDKEFDVILRYANYQTLIGIDRFDYVHSLSAKNLTAEKYNQFVWWDCEILQLPIYLASMPEYTKSVLEYRYRCLAKAKENAAKNGYDGAQFAFCSSVDGSENVWIYARHPFLQIHITADVGYGIINYYRHTLDEQFMKDKGMEMLLEISKYFLSRSTFQDGKYQILNVTGTDEHHPYINNNAYTNYEVSFVCSKTLEYIERFDYRVDASLLDQLQIFVDNLYLPLNEDGLIPQFDGYFALKPYLPLVGNGAAKGFQMKQSGLYHLSQIIKQPDVMNLYAYLNINVPGSYKKNWKYYEKMCESSSSLTYPVHSICAIDNEEYDSFKKYINDSIRIDIDDLHGCAYQGVHAGCLAGGWYGIYRGVCGFEAHENYLKVNPHFNSFLHQIKYQFYYHHVKINVVMDTNCIKLTSSSKHKINLLFNDQIIEHHHQTIIYKNKKFNNS